MTCQCRSCVIEWLDSADGELWTRTRFDRVSFLVSIKSDRDDPDDDRAYDAILFYPSDIAPVIKVGFA